MNSIKSLVGKKVLKIFMNEQFLKFVTDKGNVCFTVEGGCCSQSVFYDFIGVDKLLKNGEIILAEEIELNPDLSKDTKNYQESTSVYGYRLITKDNVLGEVSSVFSFRNYSNGYYGGWMYKCSDAEVSPEIFEDVLETQNEND